MNHNRKSYTKKDTETWIDTGIIPTELLDEICTPKTFQTWVDAKLIPEDLLAKGKSTELNNYIMNNKQELFDHYREEINNSDCEINIPSSSDGSYKFQIIHKETGTVLQTLEPTIDFELYKNKSIEIKSCHEEQWKDATAGIDEFTTDQMEIFKKAYSEIASKGYFTGRQINLLVEAIRKTKKNKTRVSGHFFDAKLRPEKLQTDISLATKMKVDEFNIKVSGIKLTPSEDKIFITLCNLLRDKSENNDTKSDKFYTGNEKSNLIGYDNGVKLKSTTMRITRAELYKDYLGKSEYSGKEIANVEKILKSLCDKKYLIIWERHYKKNNKDLVDRMEDVQPLIKYSDYFEGITKQENKRLNQGDMKLRAKKGDLIIQFNPIVTDQIDSKYIEYPEDINQRTIIASDGKQKVTDSIIAFRDYMMREISAKRSKSELNESTLIDQLRLTEYATKGRKKLVTQRINEAIEASKKLGLILEFTTEIGTQGQLKYNFKLNCDFK